MAREPKDEAVPKPSKELQEMRQEDLTAEPSLDGMLEGVDLADPRLKRFFARLLAEKKADE
jgi:hypothetical protein